jgi:hypothetical protein
MASGGVIILLNPSFLKLRECAIAYWWTQKNVMAIFQHHHHRKQARTLENEEEDKSHGL